MDDPDAGPAFPEEGDAWDAGLGELELGAPVLVGAYCTDALDAPAAGLASYARHAASTLQVLVSTSTALDP